MNFLLQRAPQFNEVFSGPGTGRGGFDGWWWVIGGCVAAVVVVLFVLSRRAGRFGTMARADEDVFMRMCQANGLTKHQVFLLRQMYHETRMANPLLLFLAPQQYEGYMAGLRGKRLELIKAVREKVFA